MTMRAAMARLVYDAQAQIISGLEAIDGGAFYKDPWTYASGGGGLTGVLEDGVVIERGGVNVSEVRGPLTDRMIQVLAIDPERLGLDSHTATFYAVGISGVIHPRNPMAPTVHFNWRYFELESASGVATWWFGGGADLTPYYMDESDCVLFHQHQKAACDAVDAGLYGVLKPAADDYFYLPFRKEHRGVGGTFYMKRSDLPADAWYALAEGGLGSILPSYGEILKKQFMRGYTDAQREWQLYRRGRYVEFNLVSDVGTQFGLASGGRTESILMSMPRHAMWSYNREIIPGSPEAELMAVVTQPRDWVSASA